MKTRLVQLVVGLICVVAFGLMVKILGPVPGEKDVLMYFQSHEFPWIDPLLVAISVFSSKFVAVSLILGMSIILMVFRKKVEAFLFLLILLPNGINVGIKEIVGRGRPEFQSGTIESMGYSFPSGHSVHAALFFGMIIILLSWRIQSYRLKLLIRCVLVLVILVVGISRIYLGAHWPTDVLGGYILAAFCMIILNQLYRTLTSDK